MSQALSLILAGLSVIWLWAARHHVRRFWATRFRVAPETPGLPDHWDPRLLGGAVILLGLAVTMGIVAVKEARAPAELDDYLTPYPELSPAGWVPGRGGTRAWIFESPEFPEEIVRFHQEEAGRRGWASRRTGSSRLVSLTIHRPGARILVVASRQGATTRIAYQIGPPTPP